MLHLPSFLLLLFIFFKKIGPNISPCESVAVTSEIPKSFSISCLTFSYVILPFFESAQIKNRKLTFSSGTLKKKFYTSKLVNPINQLESRPRLTDGFNENFSCGLVSSNSSVVLFLYEFVQKAFQSFYLLKIKKPLFHSKIELSLSSFY